MGKEVELSGLRAKKMEQTPRLRYTFGLRSAGGHLFENTKFLILLLYKVLFQKINYLKMRETYIFFFIIVAYFEKCMRNM
jgi:hypothetical protein